MSLTSKSADASKCPSSLLSWWKTRTENLNSFPKSESKLKGKLNVLIQSGHVEFLILYKLGRDFCINSYIYNTLIQEIDNDGTYTSVFPIGFGELLLMS